MLDLTEPIRTIGLYQPYATLMLHGKIETRWILKGRKPPFPEGTYLIYSCQRQYTRAEIEAISGDQFLRVQKLTLEDPSFILGHAIAIGRLVRKVWVMPGMEHETFVKYEAEKIVEIKVPALECSAIVNPMAGVETMTLKKVYHRAGLIFDQVQRIKPFPFKGKQGVGFLSPQDKTKIEFV